MNDLHFTILAALLVFCVVLLIIACLLLARAVRLLEGNPVRKTPGAGNSNAQTPVAPAPAPATGAQSPQARSEFDRFLAEDPSRQLLGKNEQAAAYRAWRKANGLTWNAGQG